MSEATCLDCGTRFTVQSGGGFLFHVLHCDSCGETKSVAFTDLGPLYERHLRGFPISPGMSAEQHERHIQELLAHAPQPYDDLGIEAILGKCHCGGRFRFQAPPRCPQCHSTSVEQGRIVESYD
jgi:hypothetical protein